MYLLEATAAGSTPGGSQYSMIIMMVGMFALMYFMMIRPQKKRQKAMQNMLDALQVGDKVVTAGGIMGKVYSIKEDSVVIETSADKTKIKFEKTSISRVLTIHE